MSERLEERLRKAAQTYRTLGGYEMEQMLLDAADTITELRGALQVASVDYRHLSEENAKLREELEQWHRLTAGIELPEYPITEFKPKDLERENAKLRELVRVMAYCNQYRRDCDGCRMNGEAGTITELAGCDELLVRLRELGIEVDR